MTVKETIKKIATQPRKVSTARRWLNLREVHPNKRCPKDVGKWTCKDCEALFPRITGEKGDNSSHPCWEYSFAYVTSIACQIIKAAEQFKHPGKP